MAGFDDSREIDVRRNVLQTRQVERIGMRVMAVMAHQRAGIALRVVILVAWEAVVDEQQRTAPEDVGPRSRPVGARYTDLAEITVRRLELLVDGLRCIEQTSFGRSITPDEPGVVNRHAAFLHTAFLPFDQAYR